MCQDLASTAIPGHAPILRWFIGFSSRLKESPEILQNLHFGDEENKDYLGLVPIFKTIIIILIVIIVAIVVIIIINYINDFNIYITEKLVHTFARKF